MNSRFIKILFLIFIIILVSCEEEETVSRNFPRIRTLAVSDISKNGATFTAEIFCRGDFKILEYGFIWKELYVPNSTLEKIVIFQNIQSTTFSSRITTTLKENAGYMVTSFVKTNDFMIYGTNTYFKSMGSNAPVINSITPLTGTIGDTIAIKGYGFSYGKSNNSVCFDDICAEITTVSDSLLTVLVPILNTSKCKISVSVVDNRSEYENDFLLSIPVIDYFFPEQAAMNDTLTIVGKNFPYAKEHNHVYIEEYKSKVVAASKKEIKVIVPRLIRSTNSISILIGGVKVVAKDMLISKE